MLQTKMPKNRHFDTCKHTCMVYLYIHVARKLATLFLRLTKVEYENHIDATLRRAHVFNHSTDLCSDGFTLPAGSCVLFIDMRNDTDISTWNILSQVKKMLHTQCSQSPK